MSGLLSRCPPLRAQAHTVRKPGCLRACCVRCPACPRWSFALRSCRSPLQVRGFPRSHLVCPHVLVWARSLCSLGGVLAEACCGRVCSRVAGFRVYARGVFAFWCLRALVCALAWGWWDNHCPAAPAPLACLLACLRAHALVWACWRVRGAACPMGGGRPCRGGTIVSRPYSVALGCPVAACAGREALRVGCSPWCANTRAHGGRERGAFVGRAVVVWAGAVGGGVLGGNTRWWRQVPKAGGEQN